MNLLSLQKENGLKHVQSPPYHPAYDGLVGRAVQTFRQGMKHLTAGSVSKRVSHFLFKYRTTLHSTTGITPAELMFGRKLQTHLDQLHPNQSNVVQQSQYHQKIAHDSHTKKQDFEVGDLVYAQNYGPGPKWLAGEIVEVSGSVVYGVCLEDGREVKKHGEQLRKRQGQTCTPRDQTHRGGDNEMLDGDRENSVNEEQIMEESVPATTDTEQSTTEESISESQVSK